MRYIYALWLFIFVSSTSSNPATNELSIISFNIQMLPFHVKNTFQQERLNSIVTYVKPFDLVVFSEVFDKKIRRNLINLMSTRFPYRTCILGRHDGSCDEGVGFICVDGGVLIFSKYPIIKQAQKNFYKTSCDLSLQDIVFGKPRQECWGSDCFAHKGVVYAQIKKASLYYHIFATHTQASYGLYRKYRNARAIQFSIINDFISQQRISRSDPVIIAGDLNVDMLSSRDEYRTMLALLNSTHPLPTKIIATFNPKNNCLNEGLQPEYLDYILFYKGYKMPLHSTVAIKMFKNGQAYWRNGKPCNALSDHYPVMGLYRF